MSEPERASAKGVTITIMGAISREPRRAAKSRRSPLRWNS